MQAHSGFSFYEIVTQISLFHNYLNFLPSVALLVFSSPYLDVSVQAVPSVYLWIQYTVLSYEAKWVSPFRYLRIKGCLLLPEAFRSLSRPSSAPDAKAFPLRSF